VRAPAHKIFTKESSRHPKDPAIHVAHIGCSPIFTTHCDMTKFGMERGDRSRIREKHLL